MCPEIRDGFSSQTQTEAFDRERLDILEKLWRTDLYLVQAWGESKERFLHDEIAAMLDTNIP